MDFNLFSSFLNGSGYILIFFLMLIEGPIATYIAAFGASQGVFDIYIVFILAILGNIIPDTILYFIGRLSRTTYVEKILHKIKYDKNKIKNLERGLDKHIGKSIITFKLTPGLAIPGLIITGFSKIKFKKFFIYSTSFNIISAIIFTLLGYYSGVTMETLLKYLRLEQFILIGLFLLAGIVYLISITLNKKILKSR